MRGELANDDLRGRRQEREGGEKQCAAGRHLVRLYRKARRAPWGRRPVFVVCLATSRNQKNDGPRRVCGEAAPCYGLLAIAATMWKDDRFHQPVDRRNAAHF